MPQELDEFWVSRQPDEKAMARERRSKKFDGSKSLAFAVFATRMCRKYGVATRLR
jgi:hypothetical protein